jgi:hypothetical protein
LPTGFIDNKIYEADRESHLLIVTHPTMDHS